MRDDMAGKKPDTVYLRQLALGPAANFVYLVGPADGDEAAVIDPAWDVPALTQILEADGRRLVAAFLTHHHGDHTNGVAPLLRTHDVPVYAARDELPFLGALDLGRHVTPVAPGQQVAVGSLPLTCIHTPGHTPGSQCFLCAAGLLSGDTVFVNACGRCDFPGGDARLMYESLHRVLGALPDTTPLLPGHDYGDVPVSSLGRERAHNPYFRATAEADFLTLRNRPRR